MTSDADVLQALAHMNPAAAFVAELQTVLGARFEPDSFARALARLAAAGSLTITAKPSPDPHLDDVDLRVVALVDGHDALARARAAEATERHWTAWLREFFANHRCS